MKRDLSQLTRRTFDVLIVGGGIYGACAVQEATLRGLSVALIDKADFGAATSANSLKIIHGGLRYLQQADIIRMRESIRERRTLLHIAPHLVHPMPVAVPTYGHGMKSKEIMSIALAMNDLVSFDRNQLGDPQKHIPHGRTISRDECLYLFPGIHEQGLTGAALFCDAQVFNSERLSLAFIRAAEKADAVVANYVEATRFLRQDGRVTGVCARDTLTDESFDIRARIVINMAGPWAQQMLDNLGSAPKRPRIRLAKAINVVTRRLFGQYALGVSTRSSYQDRDAIINKGSRLLFIAPWRDYSLIGTAYSPCDDAPDTFKVTAENIKTFISEVNHACPGAQLTEDDVLFVHKGLLPMKDVHPGTGDVQLVKHYRIDDERSGGVPGLLTVVGVKYTTARDVAEKAINRVFELWGQKAPPSLSAITPVHGGQIEWFDTFLHREIQKQPCGLQDDTIQSLIYNYGSSYREVLDTLDRVNPVHPHVLPESKMVLKAQIRYAVHEEMALKLSDVVFRRTDLGTAGYPGRDVLEFCAGVMSAELHWSQSRIQQELDEVLQAFDIAQTQGRDKTAPISESHHHGTTLAD